MSDGAEQKPKVSTLDRKVYWAKRDGLEHEIVRVEKILAVTRTGAATEYLPGWRDTLRERLTALGEPPGPRVREDEEHERSESRDRFIAAALTGLLADSRLSWSCDEIVANAIIYADRTIARASEDGEQ